MFSMVDAVAAVRHLFAVCLPGSYRRLLEEEKHKLNSIACEYCEQKEDSSRLLKLE